MKRMNFKRKLISCIIIWIVIVGSLLSYSPKNHVLSATGVPEITMIAPVGDSVFNVSTVEVTGRIQDDLTTPDQLSLKVFEHQGDAAQPIDITSEGLLTVTATSEQHAEFTFSKDFSAGVHKLSFVVTDGDGYSSTLERSFTIQPSGTEQKDESTLENKVSEVQLTQENTTINENIPAEENNDPGVSLTAESSNRPYMANMYLIPRGAEDSYQVGAALPEDFLPVEDMTRVPLNYQLLIDIRSSEPFKPSQSIISFFGDSKGTEKFVKSIKLSDGLQSYVYTFTPEDQQLVPGQSYYIYLNPNVLAPRFLKFTTVSNNYGKYQFEEDNDVRPKDYVHGPFSNVTNACAYCHSTHTGSTPTLEGGKYGTDSDNLCMACHDGTNGSPKLEKNTATNKHNQDASVSCSSCHNPHTPGTKDNPNSLKSSQVYKKASTATGSTNDYSLCLNCHNGVADEKSGKTYTNIKQYYENEPHTRQSGHNITATTDSGSQLDGQIPCAECHDTHGSKNLKMLRENLGNVKLDDPKKFFVSEGEEWNAANERNFCLSCHSNSAELYGKKATFSLTKKNGDPNTGHQDSKSQCSSCHGGESKTFREAAHAPMKLSEITPN